MSGTLDLNEKTLRYGVIIIALVGLHQGFLHYYYYYYYITNNLSMIMTFYVGTWFLHHIVASLVRVWSEILHNQICSQRFMQYENKYISFCHLNPIFEDQHRMNMVSEVRRKRANLSQKHCNLNGSFSLERDVYVSQIVVLLSSN